MTSLARSVGAHLRALADLTPQLFTTVQKKSAPLLGTPSSPFSCLTTLDKSMALIVQKYGGTSVGNP